MVASTQEAVATVASIEAGGDGSVGQAAVATVASIKSEERQCGVDQSGGATGWRLVS